MNKAELLDEAFDDGAADTLLDQGGHHLRYAAPMRALFRQRIQIANRFQCEGARLAVRARLRFFLRSISPDHAGR